MQRQRERAVNKWVTFSRALHGRARRLLGNRIAFDPALLREKRQRRRQHLITGIAAIILHGHQRGTWNEDAERDGMAVGCAWRAGLDYWRVRGVGAGLDY